MNVVTLSLLLPEIFILISKIHMMCTIIIRVVQLVRHRTMFDQYWSPKNQ